MIHRWYPSGRVHVDKLTSGDGTFPLYGFKAMHIKGCWQRINKPAFRTYIVQCLLGNLFQLFHKRNCGDQQGLASATSNSWVQQTTPWHHSSTDESKHSTHCPAALKWLARARRARDRDATNKSANSHSIYYSDSEGQKVISNKWVQVCHEGYTPCALPRHGPPMIYKSRLVD